MAEPSTIARPRRRRLSLKRVPLSAPDSKAVLSESDESDVSSTDSNSGMDPEYIPKCKKSRTTGGDNKEGPTLALGGKSITSEEFAGGINSLGKLKDLLLMLDPKSSDGVKKATSLLRLLEKCSRKHAGYYHCYRPFTQNSTLIDMVPRFVEMLRECVLTHRWDKAMRLVEVMSQEVTSADSTIWKVGTACLMQMGEAKSRLLQQFVKQLCVLQDLAVVEVLVEFLLHLLIQGNLSEVKDLMLDLRKNKRHGWHMNDSKSQAAKTLFEAYQGLVLYVQWKQAISQDQDYLSLSQDPLSQASQTSKSVADPRSLADGAIKSLSTVEHKPGVWDIFLSRVVEMLVHYGCVEQARSLLTDYAAKNPNNPNSHRYLYELETSTNNRPELREEHLKNLIKLDPSNPSCIELYKLIGEKQPSSVCLLFDCLDYNHSSNNLEVLNSLATRLEDIPTNTKLKKEVKHCWESRSSWWPSTVMKDACNKQDHTHEDRREAGTDTVVDNNNRQIVKTKRKIFKILSNL